MFSYVLNGIWHYRRINLVVMLAIAISTAVIGGSLIVGDSVRYSLRRMTELRLGRITDVIHSPRFFRQQLVDDLAAATASGVSESGSGDDVTASDAVPADLLLAPAILVNGSIERSADDDSLRRAGSVSLVALDDTGWQLLDHGAAAVPQGRDVVLGYRTARELRAEPGDEVSVWVEVPSSIPRDSLLGERDEVTVEMVLTVSHVIPEDVGASRFHLQPGQQLPYNAFLSLATLQERLGLEEIEISRRSPVAKPARINAILAGRESMDLKSPPANVASQSKGLNNRLSDVLTLKDVGLRLRTNTDRGYVSAESDRMILEDSLVTSVTAAADRLALNTAPTLVYLTNEISAAERENPDERYSMYSIVAGLPFDRPSPLGPVRLADGSPVPSMTSSDMLLSAWLAADLKVSVGDTLKAKWHEIGSHGELPEIEREFQVRGILSENDPVTVDRDLTPYVEGVTDVESFSDVDQPFEMDMERLTSRDDEYWDRHRATPKAFVSLETAEQLWNSRYGHYTSLRIAPTAAGSAPSVAQLDSIADRLAFEIPRQLNPAELGITFLPVRATGLQAAVGANDFTQLFIGFSFFLILSAIILASLMFRLGLQRRINQLGLLNAVGWPQSRVQRFFLTEGLLVCLVGCIAGTAVGVQFARLMIYGLTTWWKGAVGTSFLLLDIQPLRLVTAAGVSLVLATVVIWLALRSFRRIDIRDQLAGNASLSETGSKVRTGRRAGLMRLVGLGSALTAIALPAAVNAGLVPDEEAFGGLSWQMVCFFLAGFSSLSAGLLLLSGTLRRRSHSDSVRGALSGLGGLAIANAARSPMRSILTTALIAFATFVIVAVAAGRRNPLSETPVLNSGNGGFSLVAESAQPVLFDLNTPAGRSRLGFTSDHSLADSVRVFPFSMKPGSDASCVNLYQTRVPTLLGATDAFIERGGFRFADTPGEHPWELLQQDLPDYEGVPVIPVIGDMDTLKYSLKKGMNSHIMVPDENSPQFALQVVGMLDGSVFQGVLVMTDANLKRVDIDVTGGRYFLIETADREQMSATSTLLESTLHDYGLDAEPVSERLAGFLAVQNTYLSTFQMLGGLGLLVGTFGLAAVMMRNVVERRREIALMRAVGFTTFRVARLILSENCVLLLWGIVLGTGSALLAMLPHLKSTGADLPWPLLAGTLAVVAVTGMFASVFAVRTATRLSIRENLAAE
ncbi:MAG: FtsX-like permease family protein [Fuerstiella sp.]